MVAQKSDIKWKLIGPLITIVIVLTGFVGSYYTVKANVADLKVDQAKVEAQLKQHEEEITDLQINEAQESQVIKNIGQALDRIEEQTQKIPDIQSDIAVLKQKVQ